MHYVRIDEADLPIWPNGQAVRPTSLDLTAQTEFADHERYAARLLAIILERERDPRFADWLFRGGCGMKVRNIDRWGTPESALIHARAMALSSRVLSGNSVYVDTSWASIYREGDYCMPHSHLRAAGSVVYMLDPGDASEGDELGGRFGFCDPRAPACCPLEPGRMTNVVLPELKPGSMLFFAADYVHSVNPYRGTRPRVTLSWNVTLSPLAGTAGEWARGGK